MDFVLNGIYGMSLNAPFPILCCHNLGNEAAKSSNLFSCLANGCLPEDSGRGGNWCRRAETEFQSNKILIKLFEIFWGTYLVQVY